ncbi:hypothetical protein THOM_3091 [Trachipleistophora hominis]|uniref:Zinc-finger CCCH domain-containing protein n=1 Tax=Trachipleistophora hominis TaxID=72359 RepID=L7JR99_TRAHO|nr:hypothetical protein THOM_3091 [Trachipleistophora hominis]
MDDCYYYLYSVCTKKNCTYRHSAAAKKNLIMCKTWANKRECRNECPLRHSDYHLRKDRKDIYCYWEDMEGGCQKEFCDFRHRNPEKDEWKKVKIRTLDEIKRKNSETHVPYGVQQHGSPCETLAAHVPSSQLSESEMQLIDGIRTDYTFEVNDFQNDRVSAKVFSPKGIKTHNRAERVNNGNSPLQLGNDEFTSKDIEKELEMIDKALEEEGLDMRKLYKK